MNRRLIAIACILGAFAPTVLQHANIGRSVAVSVATPTADLQKLVAPVGDSLASHPQRKAVSLYFGAVAESLDRDAAGPKYLKTCESLRRWNEVAESRFRGELSPKVDGLAAKLNGVFLKWVGDDTVAMDAERYRKASEAARAIQWATGK